MVRLKRNNFTGMQAGGIKSQFHYGSIKTKPVELSLKFQHSLNSTMVRLKHIEQA